MSARLQLPLNETLDHPRRGERVFLEDDLIVNDKGIRLDKNLSRLQEGILSQVKRMSVKIRTNFFFRTRSLISPSHFGEGFVSSV